MKTRSKFAATAGLVFLISALLLPGAAIANTSTPIAPIPPINILPSVVKGSAPPIANGASAFLANMLYSFQKSPEFWSANKAVTAGVATPAQTKLVVENGQKYLVPGTKLAPLIKGANAAGAVLLAAQVGIQVGKFQTTLLGIDGQGLVCATQNDVARSVLGVLSGNDCTGFFEFPEGFDPNAGLQAGDVWTSVCAPAGKCFSFIGTASSATPGKYLYCYTTNSGLASNANFFVKSNGNWFGTVIDEQPNGVRLIGCRDKIPGSQAASGEHSTSPQGFQWRGSDGSTVLADSVLKPGSADPLRATRCELISTSGTVVSKVSESYLETGSGLSVPECGTLPPSEVLGSTKIWQTTQGAPDELLQDTQTTPEFQHMATEFSECMGGNCRLDLIKNSTGLSCLDDPSQCLDWAQSPLGNASYTCRLGAKTTDMSECMVYLPGFKPEAGTSGSTLANPLTGDTLPNPGTGSIPGSDVGFFGSPVQNPDSTRRCYPTGIAAFNPVEWVMVPVGCALEKAFVPRPSEVAAIQNRLVTGAGGGTIAAVTNSLNSLTAAFALGGSGCSGPPWRIQAFGVDEVFYPFNACSEPVKGAASAINGMLTFSVIGFTVLSSIRYIGASLGFITFGSGSNALPGREHSNSDTTTSSTGRGSDA